MIPSSCCKVKGCSCCYACVLYYTFETAVQTTTDISLVGLHRQLNRFGLRARIKVLLVTQEAFHCIDSRLSTKKKE